MNRGVREPALLFFHRYDLSIPGETPYLPNLSGVTAPGNGARLAVPVAHDSAIIPSIDAAPPRAV